TEKESCGNTLRKLEHFRIKLEDSDDEGNKQQPSAKGTENVKLQKDYEDFKMKGLAAIEEGDQEDNTSTSKGMVKKKACDEGIESPTVISCLGYMMNPKKKPEGPLFDEDLSVNR
ncbi:hypothetical protein Tco_1550885, partial [Tanacetum coccineum]